ncbi:MAG: retention module-containing protein [Rhodocyclales bacterium]|nr:retention module-containing protein [Rhodocyclales bacterium]
MATAGNIIGKVAVLQGQAFARAKDGTQRKLKVGDAVFENEVIVTAENSRVELEFDNGKIFLLRAKETVTLDSAVIGSELPENRNAALLDRVGELADITRAIAEGSSLDQLLEETAAGLTGGGGNDGGHNFVQLLRIAEALDPAGHNYHFNPNDLGFDLPPGGGVPDGVPSVPTTASTTDTTAGTITLDEISADVLTAAERGLPLTISGTTTGIEDGQVATVNFNGNNYTGIVTAGVFSVTVPAVDVALLADTTTWATASVSDAAGNPATPDTEDVHTTDTTAGTITLDEISADVLTAAERGLPLTISGTTTGIEDGQVATVNFNGNNYTGIVTAGVFSVTVPAVDVALLADTTTYTATASVSDAAGNPATRTPKTSTPPIPPPAPSRSTRSAPMSSPPPSAACPDHQRHHHRHRGRPGRHRQFQRQQLHRHRHRRRLQRHRARRRCRPARRYHHLHGHRFGLRRGRQPGHPGHRRRPHHRYHRRHHHARQDQRRCPHRRRARPAPDHQRHHHRHRGRPGRHRQFQRQQLHRHRHRRRLQRHRAPPSMSPCSPIPPPTRPPLRSPTRPATRPPRTPKTSTTDTTAGTITLDEISADVLTAAERGLPLTISGTTTGIEDGPGRHRQFSTATTTPASSPPASSASPYPPSMSPCSPIPPPTRPPLRSPTRPATGHPGHRRRPHHHTTAGTITLDETSDDVLTAAERGLPPTISGTTTGIEDGPVATVNFNGNNYPGIVTAGVFRVTVPAVAVALLADTTTCGHRFRSPTRPATRPPRTPKTSTTTDTTAGTITLDEISADPLTAAERGLPLTISGTTTGIEDGQVATVTFNSNNYTGIVTAGVFQRHRAAVDVAPARRYHHHDGHRFGLRRGRQPSHPGHRRRPHHRYHRRHHHARRDQRRCPHRRRARPAP